MRRRGSRIEGKKLSFRNFGMASSTSPALVESTRGRCPLRSLRSQVRITMGVELPDGFFRLPQWVSELARDLQDKDYPIEARSLGRTLKRWKHQIATWHAAQVSNGPTEAVNNLIKRAKHAAFGFTSFRNYRIRSLLYAGKPNWDLLKTIMPAVITKSAKHH